MPNPNPAIPVGQDQKSYQCSVIEVGLLIPGSCHRFDMEQESPTVSVIRAPPVANSANYPAKLTKLSDRAFGAPQTMHNLLAPRAAVTNGTYATCILLPPWQLRYNAASVMSLSDNVLNVFTILSHLSRHP